MKELTWTLKFFSELTPAELYALLKLRSEVFVVEQNCVFLDMDGIDDRCYHFMGWIGEDLAVYTRLVPPGVSYQYQSIGRVVTSPAHRQKGFGRLLMERSIEECKKLFGKGTIKIGAQLYLKKFYESLGFVQIGEVYDEDGIDHIHMLRET